MSFWGTRLSWLVLIIAIVGDFAVPYVLAIFYPNYSHTKQVMSVLGSSASPVAYIYNCWLIILGILISISAMNFYMVYTKVSTTYATLGFIILLAFGIGAGIISGIFSVNESKGIETMASKIHGIAAGLGFLLLTFIPLVIGVISIIDQKNTIGTVSLAFFIVSIGLFVLFIMSEKESYQNSIIGCTGLWQRLLLFSMYMPLLLIAIRHVIIENTTL